ncbi:MAG: guanylate kinase [Bacteroidales bacterium OttesenSCG-928-I14]|jgi:guanylate kinase|nr:guanylate kinase [Bacteroidales bacterium OttesenSCG-928-I14]
MCNFEKIKKKLIVISAPSGAGKTTFIDFLLKEQLFLELSISATSRKARIGEKNGEEYYFFTIKEFKKKISKKLFIEYEEVYPGRFYGTLKSEIYAKLQNGKNIILNLNVSGGLTIKKIYGDNVLLVFLMPPSIKELQCRLEKRGTESVKCIKHRLLKATNEISLAIKYDIIILNDDLEIAKMEFMQIMDKYIQK